VLGVDLNCSESSRWVRHRRETRRSPHGCYGNIGSRCRWPLMRFSAPYRPHESAALCADGPKSAPAALPRPLLQKNLGICELPHVGTEALSANQGDVKGMPMLAWIIGIVVAIGLIWSVAAMSNLVPVVADSDSTAI